MRNVAVRFLVICVSLCSLLAGTAIAGRTPNISPLGWGFEAGRADDGDVAALVSDQVAIRMAMNRIQTFSQRELGQERYYQLLGMDTSARMTLPRLLELTAKWWKESIDGPMARIAKNPAASCAEAQEMTALLIGRERQLQLLGLPDDESASFFTLPIFEDVRKRCHEEALDECNTTGRFDHIPAIFLGEERQAQLLGMSSVDDTWIIPVLQECAVYELHYTSTTDIDDAFRIYSIIDGRITIRPKIEGTSGMEVLSNMEFEGQAATGTNPFLQKLTCELEPAHITCSPGGSVSKPAWAKIDKLTLKSREFYVDAQGMSKERTVGEDDLKLTFSPAMMQATAVITSPDGPTVPVPFLEVGGTGFYIAHKKSETSELKFTFTENKKNGYPILFEFTRTSQDSVDDIPASDTTVFQLIHKPEKKPFPPKPPTPRRVPLKPKS